VDVNAAVYRVTGTGAAPTFLKVRRGPFDETSVRLPTSRGATWVKVGNLTLILYPFVEGHDACALFPHRGIL
jgi:hypothetical protein